MKIGNATDFAVMGLQNALQSTRDTAAKIASKDSFSSENPADLAGALVDLSRSETQAKAASEVIKTQDAMIGSLFDEKA